MQNTPRYQLLMAMLLATAAVAALPAQADTIQSTHRHHVYHRGQHARRRVATLAPISPQATTGKPASLETTAPTPNEGVTAPIDQSDQETSMAPAVMQIHYPPMGDGYTNGSSAQAMDDREAAKVTGVQLRMPLGQ